MVRTQHVSYHGNILYIEQIRWIVSSVASNANIFGLHPQGYGCTMITFPSFRLWNSPDIILTLHVSCPVVCYRSRSNQPVWECGKICMCGTDDRTIPHCNRRRSLLETYSSSPHECVAVHFFSIRLLFSLKHQLNRISATAHRRWIRKPGYRRHHGIQQSYLFAYDLIRHQHTPRCNVQKVQKAQNQVVQTETVKIIIPYL